MGMFRKPPPNLNDPPPAAVGYSREYFSQLLRTFRLYFQATDAVQHVNIASLNIDLNTLPTEADLADLRDGDVYVDTTASDVLKVKR